MRVNISSPTISHSFARMSWCIILSLGCVCWNCFNVLFNVIFYIDQMNWLLSQDLSFFLFPSDSDGAGLMPVSFKTSGITNHLPFIMIPSCTAMSSWNIQYVLMSCSIWSLFSGQPMMMYPFSHCKWLSCEVACCNYCFDMHSGMFVTLCMVSTLTFMPGISAFLFSLWLCLESQSAMC